MIVKVATPARVHFMPQAGAYTQYQPYKGKLIRDTFWL